jgi:sRNA-binding carbon storage regulator CsrA
MPRLTLNRRAGESITIGNVVVHFDWIGGASVQVVVEAPADVPVWRTELLTPAAPPVRTPPNPQLRRRQ